MNAPYRRYAPLERLEGRLDPPDAGFDCICPDECCGCGGSTRACICNVPDEGDDA